MPAYAMKPLVIENNVYTHQPQQQQMLVDEFPERPGQPDCSYFLKTGDCKFKSNCKYHHPKNCISRSLPCALNDKGLPLRPVSFFSLFLLRFASFIDIYTGKHNSISHTVLMYGAV